MLDYMQVTEISCPVTLINISKSLEEDLFLKRLVEYEIALPNLKVHTFYTNGTRKLPEELPQILSDIRATVDSSPRTYLCGPSGMMAEVSKVLEELKYDTPIIEKWAQEAMNLHNKSGR